MYASIQIVGNLANFEVKQTGEKTFAKFSVATSSWSKEGGKKTTWYNVVCWNGRTAEFLADKVGKGTKVFVTGELQQRTYTDKNGAEKTALEVVVSAYNGTILILSEWVGGSSEPAITDDEVPF